MPEAADYFLVDRDRAEIVVCPSLADIGVETRAALYDRESQAYVDLTVIKPGGTHRIALGAVQPLRRYSLKLQHRGSESKWHDLRRSRGLGHLGDLHTRTVSPGEWGIRERCHVHLRDAVSGEVLQRRPVAPGASATFVLEHSDGPTYQLEIFEDVDGQPGARLGNRMKLTPPALLGQLPSTYEVDASGLAHTRRSDVIVSRNVLKRKRAQGLASHGFIGVWDSDGPVLEASDWVLGRQQYLHLPDPPPATTGLPRAIYLGIPRPSWGHFLTQGLARVWYALENPDIPVLWHAGRLASFQKEVLDVIGLQNEQRFVTEPTAVDELIIPLPGACIGEFVLPEFAKAVGRHPGRPQVRGKKVFLSRSGLAAGRGTVENDGDQALDRLFAGHGYTIVHPERLSVREQLDEMTSAEVVVGLEGSALHSVLLMAGPISTKFWALTRHRGGSGVYAHIKSAKSLDYETLNFTTRRIRTADADVALDMEALGRALAATSGFTENLAALDGCLERPSLFQTCLTGHLSNGQVRLDARDRAARDAYLALRSRPGEPDVVATLLEPLF